MQIAGQICKVCEHSVVFANEAKFCANCGTVVHLQCEPKTNCCVCDLPFQGWEPPAVDPMGQALIPPALRSGTSGGPVFAIGCAVVFLVLVLIAYCFAHSLFWRGM
jgi:hypothetical protein